MPRSPELLSPAGSLEAVRAALANGADAVYLGAMRYNARDEGAQLSLDEVGEACALAHERGRRIYLTLNILLKPHELRDALLFLGEAVDRGIDAVIVQDLGLVRLIQRVYPELEIHGSTQMTVHDASGARVMNELGIERVVLARENTIEDIRAIRDSVQGLGLESFVHGALCISYSGQCFMSGMISERSANRGSCAQSCRKDYVLRDTTTGVELDRGYLISARDLAAHDHLEAIRDVGIGCLKIEGRKKRPEYVATVTRSYRGWLDRMEHGEAVEASPSEVRELVQIYSRGFTGGMYGGRAGRDYVTRDQPDNRGIELGVVASSDGREVIVELVEPIESGDGLGFEPPVGARGKATGFTAERVRTLVSQPGAVRQSIRSSARIPAGWRVVRSSHAALLLRARESFASLPAVARERRTRLDVRLFGQAGAPLRFVATADGETVKGASTLPLVPARNRALGTATLREQFGRLGETPFVLGALDHEAVGDGLFIPLSELNHLRQAATDELLLRRDWAETARIAAREGAVDSALEVRVEDRRPPMARPGDQVGFLLLAEVFSLHDARAAAASGATEVVLDPFLRHPTPPVARLCALRDELAGQGVSLRLRTPVIVRPEERRKLDRWLEPGLPVLTGHLGLVAELGRNGIPVTADYAVNCFNSHTAAELFALGADRVTLSIELTGREMQQLVEPWQGAGFDAVIYGRPEGMTIEHCVLSAAFDREPTTCRDLCVQKHRSVEVTDPAGYTFPVATDSACRNRLLHSRPIEGSEFVPSLWAAGIRGYRLIANVEGEPVADLVTAYRALLESLQRGETPDTGRARALAGTIFTRGHFARAV